MRNMQPLNKNFVYTLAESARATVSSGYYHVEEAVSSKRSLRKAIALSHRTPIIAEVKFRSPAEGALRDGHEGFDPVAVAKSYERGGAAAISVLTEPKHFDGNIEYLARVKRAVSVPVLMKDIVVDPIQIEAARLTGADAVLIMTTVFRLGLSDVGLQEMLRLAHSKGLEVLLEAHTKEEYDTALDTDADVIGINNRDLETLKVTLETSKMLLRTGKRGKIVISESGLSKREQLAELTSLGADGFLVGSSLMRSKNIERSVRELAGENSR